MIFVDGIPLSTSQVQVDPYSVFQSLPKKNRSIFSASLHFRWSGEVKSWPPYWITRPSSPPPIASRAPPRRRSPPPSGHPPAASCTSSRASTPPSILPSSRTSVSHMDFPGVVDNGLAQMLSSIADNDDDSDEASFDVHLIGGFDDGPKRHPINATVSERKQKKEGFSLPLCSKLIEALHNSQQKFHLQTLCVLRHNTKLDSCGNACPIVSGFLVDTSSDSIMPASFDRSSRGPDEIVRRIRVSLSSDDSNWKGRLLDTYDTCHDRFEIAPCTWMSEWKSYASSLQQLSDSEFLLRCSTSPYAEAPDFVESQRRKWNYLIENPDWRHTFTGKKPRIFQRTDDGGWSKCA
ncbi:protein N-terminal asparagine amidohydrolase isoform X1 [Musa acuminata AAA Group]|uniref:protein N-terminal asparagine amidohydrolase isoform X1 n=1 Tax=Musa acuminata AAA Group TaxID=214697 RepID=UPI0031D45779